MSGELIVKDFQYEFRNYLFGSGTPLFVESVTGLLSIPGIKRSDIERQDAHGDFATQMLLTSRFIEIEGRLLGLPGVDIEQERQLMSDAFLPVDEHAMFSFQRPGQGKRFVNARVHRRDVPSTYELAKGRGEVAIQLKAVDPRVYSIVRNLTTLTIASGVSTTTNTQVQNAGNWPEMPMFEIHGPATNPRITNNTQGRAIRIDHVIPAGQIVYVDTKARTVIIDGNDHYDKVRSDNQWWELRPGNNSITYSRTGTTGASNLQIWHYDVWLEA